MKINEAKIIEWNWFKWLHILGSEKVIELLIQNGGDINKKTNNGYTPLYLAILDSYSLSIQTFIYNSIWTTKKFNEDV